MDYTEEEMKKPMDGILYLACILHEFNSKDRQLRLSGPLCHKTINIQSCSI